MIVPYAKQLISNKNIKDVVKILKSDFLTQGPVQKKFEEKISKICKVKYVATFNSATSALHISCMALNIKKDDIVWTSTNSFVASANCALYCNAKIDLLDISSNDFNIDLDLLEKKLEHAKAKDKLPKAIVIVHFGGLPPDLKKIGYLKKKFKFKVIEDASHSLGAKYFSEPVGNCKYSDITVFSFHPVKIITTAEGGAATTNSLSLYKKLKQLSFHGITKDKKKFINKSKPNWYYEHQMLGYNYKLNEVQSALGISQLKHLNSWVKKRNIIAKRYQNEFKNLPISFQIIKKKIYSAFHLFVIIIKKNKLNISRDKIFEILKSKGIITNIHYIPIHRQPYYKKFNFQIKDFKSAEKYYENCLSIPMYAGLTFKLQSKVIKEIKKIFKSK